MKMGTLTRKLVTTAAALVALVGLEVSSAAAATSSTNNHPYPRLIALGDSITFGYNLDPRNWHPSRRAYPYLIGRAMDYQVRDLAVPGWTSTDLLQALKTNRSMQSSVKYANVVTIDIGSNDILSIAAKDGLLTSKLKPKVTSDELKQFAQAIGQLGPNLAQIVAEVKLLSPDATVILYNIYDPISPSVAALHAIAEPLIAAENLSISAVAKLYGLPIADAYSAFNGKQAIDVRLGDVHPTLQGQEALAQAGEAVLQQAAVQ